MNFIEELIRWYNDNKRDLPWRKTRDPYIIWLSEIILQQTRVDQGLPYFHRFSEKYPTVADFAAASEDEILNLWQGLGYYSRGRNMHKTAKMVMEEHAGYFPGNYEKLIGLKGIGEYTAAAISSFSSDEAKAVVDGNVFRVLARYYGIDEVINTPKGKRTFLSLANDVIDKKNPGLSNQAMMEFGALLCKPANPDCEICPLRLSCYAFNNNMITSLPVKQKKAKSKTRYFNYIIAVRNNQILMNKRGVKDIWQGLHDFPLFEGSEPTDAAELILKPQFTELFGNNAFIKSVHGPVKHVLSHQTLLVQYISIANFTEDFADKKAWFFINFNELEHLAQPKLVFAFLKMFPNLKDD